MIIKLKLDKGASCPVYSTEGAAGADIKAAPGFSAVIDPGCFLAVPTGIYPEIPEGYEIQVRPRSGLAFRHGVTVLNSPGTIDSDYRGEIKVILINHGKEPFTVNGGDRIAQLVAARTEMVSFVAADSLSDTERGDGGFGSTGV